MKTLTALLITIFSLSTFAIEIQCYDPAGIHFTIVTSKKTNITYLVCDDGDNLIRYIPLYDDLMKTEGQNKFTYDENILHIKIEGSRGIARTVEGRDLCAGYTRLFSNSCTFFPKEENIH